MGQYIEFIVHVWLFGVGIAIVHVYRTLYLRIRRLRIRQRSIERKIEEIEYLEWAENRALIPLPLSSIELRKLKESMRAEYKGCGNAGKIAILNARWYE